MRFEPYLRRLTIVDKNAVASPFHLNQAQQKYLYAFEEKWNQGLPVRAIVLKARQIGLSTLTEGLIFLLAMLQTNQRSLIIGNEIDNAQHLLSMTTTFWETYPFKSLYTPKYASRNELAWSTNGSSIRVATARNASVGRGKTIRALHASEIAFWEHGKETMLSIAQAVPRRPFTFICMESTANGVGGYFHETWQAAEEGEVDYMPLFFPWHEHNEYRASAIGLPYHSLGKLDSEEKILQSFGVSDDRLAWRRWCIKNNCNNDVFQFHQEYPTTPEEAFVSTGTNVYPIEHLRHCYKPMPGMRGRLMWESDRVRFKPDATGPITIFFQPSADRDYGQYMIGGDPTHTTVGDNASAQVINRRNMEQVAIYNAKIDPASFGTQLDLLGRYYNDAVIAPEFEGPGASTVATLIANNYPHIWENKMVDNTRGKGSKHKGWRTTAKSKDFAITWLLKLVVDHDITIHDSNTFKEMKNYITLEGGGYGNADDTTHDDRVMALAISMAAHHLDPPLLPYGAGGEAAGTPWEDWNTMQGHQ